MKKLIIIAIAAMSIAGLKAEWKIAGSKIKTQWAEKVTPQNVLSEYPRPSMERKEWMSLNGLWQYSVTDLANQPREGKSGEILVPFAIESALSGVQSRITENDFLHYSREFSIPKTWSSKRVMLNFGAVDWECTVSVNGIMVGRHTGGYTSFSFDITDALKAKGPQRIDVRVWDPTDHGPYPVGKQSHDGRKGRIWYTPVSGIWQSVWLEPVCEKNYIKRVYTQCDISRGEVTIFTECKNDKGILRTEIFDKDKKVAQCQSTLQTSAVLTIPNAKLWSPDSPFLYDMKITLELDGKVVDCVKTYTALREISTKRDALGHKRVTLNGKNTFMYGPLDQGWWPDGLYTAPTDEALLWDVDFTRNTLGFNTIRKHIKVEPDRWYYHCDRLGILVWQDMPSMNHLGYVWARNDVGGGSDMKLTQKQKDNYYKEWEEIIEQLRMHPCVVVWVPFNEAWAQFDTEKVTEWTKRKDPSRLVNPASGGNLRLCGDIMDIHHYPDPIMPFHDSERVVVVGEYGGIGLPVEDHLWENNKKKKKNWGYIRFSSIKEVTDEYVKYAEKLLPLINEGVSAAIYTQTTDVESEVNGFTTYDRKVEKMDYSKIKSANQQVIKSLK